MKTLRQQYLEQFTQNMLTAVEITKRKGQDYSPGDDPYKNFRLCGHICGVDVPNGILVRISDKLSRIKALIDRPGYEAAVADEKLTDTIADLMVYSNILLTWFQLGQPSTEYSGLDLPESVPEKQAVQTDTVPAKVTKVGEAIGQLFGWSK